MTELPVHTLIGEENKEGGLLLCGLNHGYSKEDERLDATGIDRSDSHKSFFSDSEVNDYPFRNKIVSWFSLWGYELARSKETANQFERSIIQTNWLQTCSNNMGQVDIKAVCIEDNESFFNTCEILKPSIIFFFGRDLLWAFTSNELTQKVESIFGAKIGTTKQLKKDVVFNGKKRRAFTFAFQQYEKLTVVFLPHATGSKGLANDYVAAFKQEMSGIIECWWCRHKQKLRSSQAGAQP